MALAVATKATDIIRLSGGVRIGTATITLDSNYPTGGSAGVTPLLGLGQVLALVPLASLGYHHEYVPGSDKLKHYVSGAAGAVAQEVANATNLSANQLSVLYIAI